MKEKEGVTSVKKVLFVCTGNVCRSPMAEGLLKHEAGEWPVIVESAGLAASMGAAPSQHAQTAMAEIGIDISAQHSQSVTTELVRSCDAIFVMTYAHLDMMLLTFPAVADRVFLIREFCHQSQSDVEVGDPYGGSVEEYRRVRDEIREAIPGIMAFLKGETEIPKETAQSNHARVYIAIGADHGGVELKAKISEWLADEGYHVEDYGSYTNVSVDYPDYAQKVAVTVAQRRADFGILICKSGIGMSIAANKVSGARAALIHSAETAKLSREHNNANVLCLAANEMNLETAKSIVECWLKTPFSGGRHTQRVEKVESLSVKNKQGNISALAKTDRAIYDAIQRENQRQSENIELIASENFTSQAVMEAQGSCLTNKYAEGYPGKRWYGGCEHVDEVEQIAIDRAKKLFTAEHVNVQPHSGSQANMAVYFSVLKPGDKIMTMNLSHGGHLTHGHPMNFSGRLFDVVHYGVDEKTEVLDYGELARMAEEHKPKMITAGASAYSRVIDFKRMREIADSVGAYLFVDMAHIAGLVAAGAHPSPIPHADFVTTTTHKTLRGPRGGLILCQSKYAKDIDSQVFPGTQGGPLMHVIAAKAVCFWEALQPEFIAYQQQVVRNSKALCEGMKKNGFRIVSGTTENHVMLVDLQPMNVTGKDAQELLDHAGITVNKNAIPFDKQSPFKAGGIRLGSPAVTTRGFKEEEMFEVADLIHRSITGKDAPRTIATVRERVRELARQFPQP